jgi:hypothetical protein
MSLTMDQGSSLNVSAISYIPLISDPDGISGDSAINITGNGYNVEYDGTLSANSYLGTRSYYLRKGGLLTCPTCTLDVTTITASQAGLKYFPDPASASLHISINENIPQKVSVYNIYGIKVFETTVTKEALIDVSSWANGAYFLVVNNKFNRFIVIH